MTNRSWTGRAPRAPRGQGAAITLMLAGASWIVVAWLARLVT